MKNNLGRRGTSGKALKSSRRDSQMSVNSKIRGGSEKHKIESIVIDVKDLRDRKAKRTMKKSGTLESIGSRGLNENSGSDASSVKMQNMVELKDMKNY